jgi:DNA modification methylase
VQDADFTLYVGDVREVLAGLPDESVQCVVTSPPYWGLRDYGTEGQLGLEPTPELYVENMVAVFREVRRVLRRDGTCWLNIGDSYVAQPSGSKTIESKLAKSGLHFSRETLNDAHTRARLEQANAVRGQWAPPPGLLPKNLVGIPWRLAFALQADGWYLRSEIIWAKPNPMPESVTDRPTKSHEQVFLLTRSKSYFYDAEAVREAFAPASEERYRYAFGGKKAEDLHRQDAAGPGGNRTAPIGKRTFPGMPPEADRGPDGRRVTTVQGGEGSLQHRDGERWPNAGRNLRSVWELPTEPFPEAHFATYPQALVERCIKAGTRLGDVVMDPFGGSGTTALVARRLGRKSLLIELNPDYAEMSARRLSQLSLLAEPAA